MKAVEKERNELETVKDEAVAYLRLLNKLTRIKNVIYQKNQNQEASDERRFRNELVEVEQQAEVRFPSFKPISYCSSFNCFHFYLFRSSLKE